MRLVDDGRYFGVEEVILRCRCPGPVTGLAVGRPERGDLVVPADVRADALPSEHAAGRRWQVSADSFFQSRPDAIDAMADLVRVAVETKPPGRAVDLYSGVGIFAGVLAEPRLVGDLGRRRDVVSIADARHNLAPRRLGRLVRRRQLGTDPSEHCRRRPGVQWVSASGATPPSPPAQRASCSSAVTCSRSPAMRRFSLKRDTSLVKADLVDVFPHTHHVEIVSLFDRPE